VVEVTSQEVRGFLPRFAGELDQPSADGLNTWLISRAAARDVKGVLSGLGGDECFAGYPVTRRMARNTTTARGRAQALAAHAAHRLAPWLSHGALRDRVENLASRRSALATWLRGHTVFHDGRARQMVGLNGDRSSGEALAAVLDHDTVDWSNETMVGLSCLLDARVYMTQQLLRDSDASSMAHSLELRVPFVDWEVFAFSRSCRDDYKLRPDGGTSQQYGGSGSKRVLIQALADLLPHSIGNRPKKGFALPHEHWMRGSLADVVDDTCGAESVARRGLLDPAMVASVRREARSSAPGSTYPTMWTLMILELWCRAVLDKYRPTPSPRCAVGAS
jgi:asparagine synthase (glutamine-hydrolysing)